uniref:Uncharacterized protein n=1 Tax=Anguilla anguilla TaxID=7936 RepID=A0A0E9VUZ4_ANGAN
MAGLWYIVMLSGFIIGGELSGLIYDR